MQGTMRTPARAPGLGRVQWYALALFFVCLCPTPQSAQQSAASVQAAAEAGNSQAQYDLATDYFNARFATLDYVDMLTWYRKSAAQGFAPAQNQLGAMYENNLGVPQDYKRAASYYRMAANQGYAQAQYNLAAL